jgi:hypothetical protein
MRNKWVDLMTRRGALARAEMTYMRNNSPPNFRVMCRARVAYEAAVETIGKDVVAKSRRIEDAAIRPAQSKRLPPST